MKTRLCFVSNSSSSSFLIAAKEQPTAEQLLEVFNVGKESPLYPMAKEMAKVLVDRMDTFERYYGDYGETLRDYFPDKLVDRIEAKDYKTWHGSVSDECTDGAERALVEVDFDYECFDFILHKEGGY